ncbi:GIY-YIG nuclease family protein [Rheinheimera sp.]|uniref:GIY-YIG nuclease family protein n=1 Tax=Rheinheimera sp. TaxID=1869214 RepID=UPI002621333A|nr:GIY-YIG nuclease family protein [Rheinheimera sp.]MCA1930043.1 GIY-YIG nuclease family protein [Rheinheimera sp.]
MTAVPTPWFVYMVRTATGALYTGISTDPERRLRQHSGALTGGAKALKGKGPLQLVFTFAMPCRSSASKLEYQLKQWNKTQKELLLKQEVTQLNLLQQLSGESRIGLVCATD